MFCCEFVLFPFVSKLVLILYLYTSIGLDENDYERLDMLKRMITHLAITPFHFHLFSNNDQQQQPQTHLHTYYLNTTDKSN